MGHSFKLIVAGFALVAATSAASFPIILAQQSPARPASTGTGLLAGQVVDAETGRPIPNSSVALAGAAVAGAPIGRPAPPLITDSQGRFVFSGLAAGTYLTAAQRAGYSGTGIPVKITELADGARTTNLTLRLHRYATLSGTVRDEAGDPVVGTTVIAFRRSAAQGRPPELLPAATGTSDDRGRYRLTDLSAGNYYVCACRRDPVPLDGHLLTTLAARPLDLLSVAMRAARAGADAASLDDTLRTIPPTFHPSATQVSQAAVVTTDFGEDQTNIDISATAVRATRVSGRIIGAPESVLAASRLTLVPAGDIPEATAITQFVPMLQQPDGRFDFAGIPPGTYTLEVHYRAGTRAGGPSGAALAFLGARGAALRQSGSAPPSGQESLWARQTVAVGDVGVTDMVVGLQRGVTVRGRIDLVGSRPPPDPRLLQRGGVSLAPLEVSQRSNRSYRSNLSVDGAFVITGIIPGRYQLTPNVPIPGWEMLKSITVGPTDITDALLTLDGSDTAEIVITITDTVMATLSGTVSPGPSDEERVVIRIFPTDRRYWQDPVGAFRRFKTASVDPKGIYAVTRIPAGEYFVVAATQSDTPDWLDPEALEVLAKSALRVQISDAETKTLEVKR